jgi:ATP synthase protein I
VIEPGRLGAYLALFSEIGAVLFFTTLAGSLGGHWLDERFGTNPILLLVGLFLGLAAGAIAVWRLINRFLASFKD